MSDTKMAPTCSAAATLATLLLLLTQINIRYLLGGRLSARRLLLQLFALAEGGSAWRCTLTSAGFLHHLILDLLSHGIESHVDVLGRLGTSL